MLDDSSIKYPFAIIFLRCAITEYRASGAIEENCKNNSRRKHKKTHCFCIFNKYE